MASPPSTGAYRLTPAIAGAPTTVVRASDGAFIPDDPRNADWVAYQAWLAVPGNTPDPAPAPPVSTTLSPLQFIARFTAAEQTAIATAGQSNAQISLFLTRAAAADYIDLADPQTSGGVEALVSAGLLTQARTTAILAVAPE